MKKITLLTALLVLLASAAFGDIRVPDSPKPTPAPKAAKGIEMPMSIKIVKGETGARLLIPKSKLKQLRAELDELEGADSDANASLGSTRVQTIISGTFLSLALVFGGVWFARSRKSDAKVNKTIAAGAVLFAIATFGSVAFANIGPPMSVRNLTGKIFSQEVNSWKRASGTVKLEATTEGDMILLIVPDVADETKPE